MYIIENISLFFLEIYVFLVLDFDIFIRYQYTDTIELKMPGISRYNNL